MKYFLFALAVVTFVAGAPAYSADEEAIKDAELEARLEAARKRLDEAARQVGELSSQLHGDAMRHVARIVHRNEVRRRPMIGINIGEREINGETSGTSPEGVVILGVTPGGPADKAGLKADDVITRLNGESLAGGGRASNDKLMAIMDKVEPGDTIEVEYLRDGRKRAIKLETGTMPAPRMHGFIAPGDDSEVFSWVSPEGAPRPPMPLIPGRPGALFAPMPHAWDGMEMVPLTPGLGEYFNTEKGLLVVRAPATEGTELEDGDVILEIGGREPKDVGHAMRILRSYQPGEKVELEVMRKKRKRKLNFEVPESAAFSAAPGFQYHFVTPGAEGEYEVRIERDDEGGGDREVIIRKQRIEDGEAVPRERIVVEDDEVDIGT